MDKKDDEKTEVIGERLTSAKAAEIFPEGVTPADVVGLQTFGDTDVVVLGSQDTGVCYGVPLELLIRTFASEKEALDKVMNLLSKTLI